jgi:hypothetical protein
MASLEYECNRARSFPTSPFLRAWSIVDSEIAATDLGIYGTRHKSERDMHTSTSRRLGVAQRRVCRPQTYNNTDIDSRVSFPQLLILRGDLRNLSNSPISRQY